jgi:DNA-binding transcriptional LysR family regulator
VLDNMADFGITQLPVQEKKLQVVKIHSDEIRLVAAQDHPLAGKESVTCYDLASYPLLLPKSGTTRSRLNAWMEPVEDELNTSMELDSTEMMKQFVMAGLGLSFLAVSNCRDEIRAGRLAAIPIAPEPMTRQLGLIYRKDKSLSKAALGFIQVTIDHAGARQTYRSVQAASEAVG